jgi:ParB family chromosome partitioning protein
MSKRKSFSIESSLANALSASMEAAKNYGGDLNVEIIQLKNIKLDPKNPRIQSLNIDDLKLNEKYLSEEKKKEKERLESLAISIKNQGVINPIIVYKDIDKYQLIAGERRTLASILAGKSDIPARILNEKPSALKVGLLQWIENIERKDLGLWEKIINFEKICYEYAADRNVNIEALKFQEVAEMVGLSYTVTIYYKNVMLGSDLIRKAVKNNLIRNLEKASIIAKAPLEIQEKLIAICESGTSIETLRGLVNKLQAEMTPIVSFVKPKGSPGRSGTQILLGSTKNINVAKLILESVLKVKQFREIADKVGQINWESYNDISKAFRTMLSELEKKSQESC